MQSFHDCSSQAALSVPLSVQQPGRSKPVLSGFLQRLNFVGMWLITWLAMSNWLNIHVQIFHPHLPRDGGWGWKERSRPIIDLPGNQLHSWGYPGAPSPQLFSLAYKKNHHFTDSNCFRSCTSGNEHKDEICISIINHSIITSFKRYVQILLQFYGWGNWDPESLSNFPKGCRSVESRESNPCTLISVISTFYCLLFGI